MEKSSFEAYQYQLRSLSKMNLDLFASSYMAANPMMPSSTVKDKLYQVEQDGTAKINISGVLKNSRSFWDSLLGSKTSLIYDEIIQVAQELESDPTVKKVDFYFDTPGGEVLGMDNAAVAVSLISKPTTAYVRNMCASGGVYLASQCDEIIALSEGSMIGSIGIMQRMYVDPEIVSVTSSNAPRKNPDPMTAKGKAMIVDELDEMEELFIRRVAEGRGVTVETVKEKFGQGGTMLAKRALESGLIDRIETQKLKMTYVPPVTDPGQEPIIDSKKVIIEPAQMAGKIQTKEYSPNEGQKPKERKRMDIQILRNEHPDVFAQAVKVGEENERKRVAAFSAYKTADPANEKLVALCEQYVAEGKQLEEVLPSLQVAIRDFKGTSAGNPPSVGTDGVDPIEQAAKVDPKQEAAKIDVKASVEKYKKAGLFQG